MTAGVSFICCERREDEQTERQTGTQTERQTDRQADITGHRER